MREQLDAALETHGLYLVFIAFVVILILIMSAYAVWEAWDGRRGEQRGPDPDSSGGSRRPPAFVCPDCGAQSWHPGDGRWGYCGRCKSFTGRPAGLDVPTDDGRAA